MMSCPPGPCPGEGDLSPSHIASGVLIPKRHTNRHHHQNQNESRGVRGPLTWGNNAKHLPHILSIYPTPPQPVTTNPSSLRWCFITRQYVITVTSHNGNKYKAGDKTLQLTHKYEQVTRAHTNQIDLEIDQIQLLEIKNIILVIAEFEAKQEIL